MCPFIQKVSNSQQELKKSLEKNILSEILKEGHKLLSLIEEIDCYGFKLLFEENTIDFFFKGVYSAQEGKEFISEAPVFAFKDEVNVLYLFLGVWH